MKTTIEQQIVELKLEKKRIDERLKPLEKELKRIKEEEKINSLQMNGFSDELIKFYNYKIPSNNNNDYMSWCVQQDVSSYFSNMINDLDLNRYQTYLFTDIMQEYLDVDDWKNFLEEYNATISIETLEKRIDTKTLKDIDQLPALEQNGVRLIIKMIYGITSNKFQWDW